MLVKYFTISHSDSCNKYYIIYIYYIYSISFFYSLLIAYSSLLCESYLLEDIGLAVYQLCVFARPVVAVYQGRDISRYMYMLQEEFLVSPGIDNLLNHNVCQTILYYMK